MKAFKAEKQISFVLYLSEYRMEVETISFRSPNKMEVETISYKNSNTKVIY